MNKILTIVGARPQFVKAGVVSAELRNFEGAKEVIVHTGQHFDANMSDQFFTELGLGIPDINLGINGGSHGEMTGRMLMELEKVMTSESPDIVLVYGDTNSTLAGALAAAKLHIPIAHIEAGLRSFNRTMPEEINRVMTDHLSTWLFTPTNEAVSNLSNEGINAGKINLVGDVMYDAAIKYAKISKKSNSSALKKVNLEKPYILATIHRAENTDNLNRLKTILDSFNQISEEIDIIWPMHPRTKNSIMNADLWNSLSQNITILEPVGYLDMIKLETNSSVIVTDSGGVQKEAFFYNVPCVTLRDETEWVELLSIGWNTLSPPKETKAVVNSVQKAIGSKGQNAKPYGHGNASRQIAEILCK